jgi:hypothetical protein
MTGDLKQDLSNLGNILSDYYRTPLSPGAVVIRGESRNGSGFFRFGPNLVCYGESVTGVSETVENSPSFDAYSASKISNSQVYLPFDISRTIDDLRLEHYFDQLYGNERRLIQSDLIRKIYYLVRAPLPVWLRRYLQRAYFRDWRELGFPHWPVDTTVDSLHREFLRLAMKAQGLTEIPFIWFWPQGAPSCLIITHDVETGAGVEFTPTLMDIDDSHGFKSSFQVVPEKRYQVRDDYVCQIRKRGFEFNIHDLNHDGHLFEDRAEFARRAAKINEYLGKYGSHGFRSGAMYRKLDWFDAFQFSYDMSVPNVAHLEPQRGGCCTVMPYFNGKILELPLTTSQDYTVVHILNHRTIDLWKEQVRLIQQNNGLISILSHPDYLIDLEPREMYNSLLAYLRSIVDRDAVWAALPGELNQWWRARAAMKLVQDGDSWRIEGPESERARIAYAILEGDNVRFNIGESNHSSK